jgi:hypothetical protein
MFECLNWTTEDELEFVRHLFVAGNVKALESYVKVAPDRIWYGRGMNVDPQQVILEAKDLLAELHRSQRQAVPDKIAAKVSAVLQ